MYFGINSDKNKTFDKTKQKQKTVWKLQIVIRLFWNQFEQDKEFNAY